MSVAVEVICEEVDLLVEWARDQGAEDDEIRAALGDCLRGPLKRKTRAERILEYVEANPWCTARTIAFALRGDGTAHSWRTEVSKLHAYGSLVREGNHRQGYVYAVAGSAARASG